MTLERPEQYRSNNGIKALLPFGPDQYRNRLAACAALWNCVSWMWLC